MMKSIFEKVSFKGVLLFFLVLIAIDIWSFTDVFRYQSNISASFLLISMGVLLIGIGIFASYRKEEKLAMSILGTSLIISWLGKIKFLPIFASSSFSILFKISALYCFWISYKSVKTSLKKSKHLFLFLLLIIIFISPAIFFWMLGIILNLAK